MWKNLNRIAGFSGNESIHIAFCPVPPQIPEHKKAATGHYNDTSLPDESLLTPTHAGRYRRGHRPYSAKKEAVTDSLLAR
jgi:hypothetical protein